MAMSSIRVPKTLTNSLGNRTSLVLPLDIFKYIPYRIECTGPTIASFSFIGRDGSKDIVDLYRFGLNQMTQVCDPKSELIDFIPSQC